MANWSYTVTYVSTNTDISSHVVSIENFTDVGSGEVNSAKLILNARAGNFITESNSGATPILDEFDKIKISITDKNNDTYSRILEVDTLMPKKTIQDGVRLEVELLGQERCLQQVHFAKQYYYENAYACVKDIVKKYEANKGSAQVSIEKEDDSSYNELPQWTANNYDFGSKEMFCYDGINEVLDRLGTSVSGGGAGDFYEQTFDDHASDSTKIYFRAFSSGSKPTSTSNYTTVENAVTTPIYSTEGTTEAKTGTVIVGKGATGYGTFPSNSSVFAGKKEEFALTPEWKTEDEQGNDIAYPQNSRVIHNGVVYKSNINNNTSTPPSNWTSQTAKDLIGSDFRYSPYTKMGSSPSGLDGYKAWRNSGSRPNPEAESGSHPNGQESGLLDLGKHGCWDSNLVIRDEDHFRTWVDCIATSPSGIPSEYKFGGSALYRGFRVLVKGTGSGDFSSFTNKPIQYDGTNWKVIKEPDDDDQIAVIDEGYNYLWNGSSWSNDWVTVDKSNDCFHVFYSSGDGGIYNGQGMATLANGGSSPDTNYGYKSAVEYEFRYTPVALWADWFPLFRHPNYYSAGAWACFRFPFPSNSYSSQTIGSQYGGDSNSSYEPVTFDPTNFHLLPNGKSGFNQSNSKELGTCDALKFLIKMKWFYYVGASEVPRGWSADYKMRCTCYDTSDNVVVQDFTINFDDNWEEIVLPLSGFKIYRARASLRWGAVASNLIVPELEITEIFEWKNLRLISIQFQDAYDDEARFDPLAKRLGEALQNPVEMVCRLSIDNFCFTKQLLAVSGQDSTRNIEPKFLERPTTTNYSQLETDVKSQEEIEKFRYQAFDIESEGECDPNLKFGYSFYLKDDKLVNLADNGTANSNTIKLVAKKIEYTINGTGDGSNGGFVRKITGVKRI